MSVAVFLLLIYCPACFKRDFFSLSLLRSDRFLCRCVKRSRCVRAFLSSCCRCWMSFQPRGPQGPQRFSMTGWAVCCGRGLSCSRTSPPSWIPDKRADVDWWVESPPRWFSSGSKLSCSSSPPAAGAAAVWAQPAVPEADGPQPGGKLAALPAGGVCAAGKLRPLIGRRAQGRRRTRSLLRNHLFYWLPW